MWCQGLCVESAGGLCRKCRLEVYKQQLSAGCSLMSIHTCVHTSTALLDAEPCLFGAAFVTCSAAGMALGPLLAVPMSRVPTVYLGPLTFNPITAGAWVMSLIWLVFLAVTVFFFQEPPVR